MKFSHKRLCLPVGPTVLILCVIAVVPFVARADRPYAPSRDYDLQNVRVALRFDLDQRKVIGDVTHTLSVLHDGLTHLDFDSADLTISSARVDGQEARFELKGEKLIVNLAQPAKSGQKSDFRPCAFAPDTRLESVDLDGEAFKFTHI